jgi:hypothetical protein
VRKTSYSGAQEIGSNCLPHWDDLTVITHLDNVAVTLLGERRRLTLRLEPVTRNSAIGEGRYSIGVVRLMTNSAPGNKISGLVLGRALVSRIVSVRPPETPI